MSLLDFRCSVNSSENPIRIKTAQKNIRRKTSVDHRSVIELSKRFFLYPGGCDADYDLSVWLVVQFKSRQYVLEQVTELLLKSSLAAQLHHH